MTAEDVRLGPLLLGPFHAPRNLWQEAPSSIHNDETAKKLGFAGGTIPASVHLEQLLPFCGRLLGERWPARGNISAYFLNATVDGEEVRCGAHAIEAGAAGAKRFAVFMEKQDGTRVLEGTASAAADDPRSELSRRLAAQRPPGELRMLKGVKAEARVTGIKSRIAARDVEKRLTVITEILPEYRNPKIYGGIVLPADPLINAFRRAEGELIKVEGPFVGLFGAFELRFYNGPVFADRDYLVDAGVRALGDSPKTELLWYEADLRDAATGERVAAMLHMTRLMKASSPLWAA